MIKYPDKQTHDNIDENEYKQDEVYFAEYCNTNRYWVITEWSECIDNFITIEQSNKIFYCFERIPELYHKYNKIMLLLNYTQSLYAIA